jgi:hypothetical protein
MKKSQKLLLGLFLVGSCSHHMDRGPATALIVPPDLSDLKLASETILKHVGSKNFPEHCVSYLSQLEKKIDELDLKTYELNKVIDDSETIAQNSWGVRLKLHQRLPEFNEACAIQVQSNFRQLRFIEEYLLELNRKVTHLNPSEIDFQKQPIPIKNSRPYYVFNTGERNYFKSGDLFITRGVSFLSSMIARLGDRPGQFSHIVMAYKDPERKRLRTIESYVGVGVDFYDLDFALKNENARLLWLRSKDGNLGVRAGNQIGTHVKKILDRSKKIKYDYILDFDNPETMSCAEVSQVAFEKASGGRIKLPYYPSKIVSNDITKRLKFAPGTTFSPSDMEIDPRFEIIGEFRDLRLTRDSRQKDAIMTSILKWIEKDNYVLKDSFNSAMAGGVIYDVRRTFLWPLVQKFLKLDDFSEEIPRNMLRTVALINEVGEILLKELKERDLDYEQKYGIPMTYMDFYRYLEELRARDLKVYRNVTTRHNTLFHKYLRPND